MTKCASSALPDIKDQNSLLRFLTDPDFLDWPVPLDATMEELTFDWTENDLRLSSTTAEKLNQGTVRQFQFFSFFPLAFDSIARSFTATFAAYLLWRSYHSLHSTFFPRPSILAFQIFRFFPSILTSASFERFSMFPSLSISSAGP